MHIAICDDEAVYQNMLKENIIKYAKTQKKEITISIYSSGRLLTEELAQNLQAIQMVFLDVEMPEWSGMQTAEAIRQISDEVQICFITSYKEYALDAYGLGALGYIVKPVGYGELEKVLDKAVVLIDHIQNTAEAQKRYLTINSSGKKQVIDTQEVLYIEKQRNKSILYLEEESLVAYETLKDIYDRLDQQKFVYTHQGYIVRFETIKEVREKEVCLGKHIEVPLSRSRHKQVLERFQDKIERLRQKMQ